MRAYGRQKQGRTIKSVSLDDDVASRAQKEADKRGISFSELVNGILSGTIKLSLIAFLALHLTRSPKRWDAASLRQTAAVAVAKIQHLAK